MRLNKIQTVKNLSGRRVLLRLDLNVPLAANKKVLPEGAWRIERSVPTVKYLVRKKAKIIIVAHLGRPQGRIVESMSLAPVAEYLGRLLKKKIQLWPHDFVEDYKQSLALKPGVVVMLENIRWQPREQLDCHILARRLSRLADLYVNDAFGNIHRQDSSMLAITEYLPSYAGLLLQKEVKYLTQILQARSRLAVIFGGAKISSKLKLIKKFVQCGPVLLGGALANTVLKARGYKVGRSLIDDEGISVARKLKSSRLYLPSDVVVATSMRASKSRVVPISKVPHDMFILDLGPGTIARYLQILRSQKIIVWNGPLGYFENKRFILASQSMLLALAKLPAKVIIGGGETIEMVNQLKLENKFSFVSTGGGAMLSFLQGDKLPVLQALKK